MISSTYYQPLRTGNLFKKERFEKLLKDRVIEII